MPNHWMNRCPGRKRKAAEKWIIRVHFLPAIPLANRVFKWMVFICKRRQSPGACNKDLGEQRAFEPIGAWQQAFEDSGIALC